MDEPQHDGFEKQTAVSTYWWVRQLVLILIAGFYLIFGIQLLISAYRLNEPATFILTFYASNFMILFSGALMAGFIYRLVVAFRRSK